MAPPSLMTLPREVRLVIWNQLIPDKIEVEVPGSYAGGQSLRWNYIPMPKNPSVPLLLINKQAREEVANIANTTIAIRVHDTHALDHWLQTSTSKERKPVKEIRIDDQIIRSIRGESSSRLDSFQEWYINNFGDDLIHHYGHVEKLRSDFTEDGSEGYLDVTFQVGDPYSQKLAWQQGRFKTGQA